MNNLDRAWSVYMILEAVEWKWTPAEVEAQEDALLRDVLTIKFADNRIKEMRKAA